MIHKIRHWTIALAFGASSVAGARAAGAATVIKNVSTVSQLYAAFETADSQPADLIEIRLAPGTYLLPKNTSVTDEDDLHTRTAGRLKLKYGKVKLVGGANRAASFNYVIDGGWYGSEAATTALLRIGQGTSGNFRPEIYIHGVRLQNAWGSGMPPIQVLNARLDMFDTTVSRTRVDGMGGGGLYANNNSDVTITRSFFQNNTVLNAVLQSRCGGLFDSGGALSIANSNAWIYNSTFQAGVACRGGGIFFSASSGYKLVLNQSTVTQNSARTRGAGVHIIGAGAATLSFNTITHNFAALQPPNLSAGETQGGGGISFDKYAGSLKMFGNIVAYNTAQYPLKGALQTLDAKDCLVDGSFTGSTSVNGNLLREQGNCTFIATGPLVGTSAAPVDPKLGTLMEGAIGTGNAGTILVQPPLSGSKALGAYRQNGTASCPTLDQIDKLRPLAPGTCTIGSVEKSQ